MSEKANYFKIGLFFVVSVILIVTAVIVWGAGLFTKDKIHFETYFDSPVTGLNVGASVLLMGVEIGQVEAIDFAAAVYDISTDPGIASRYERYVRVLCSMSTEKFREQMGDMTDELREARTGNLVQQGLRLRLASNILTGQAYLEGVYVDPNRFPPLAIKWEPKHDYVASAPGGFSTMKDSVDKILEKMEDIDLQEIVENVNQLLAVTRKAVEDANVPGATSEMKSTFAELRGTNQQIQQLLEDTNVPGVTGEMKNLFAELRGTNQQIQTLLTNPDEDAKKTNLPQIMARLDNTLENINRMLITETPEIDKFLRNLRAISDDVRELTAMIKEHPSEVIFSEPPARSEIVK